ncbi:MAG: sugar ABC transporter permease [Anaerolineae bacterium]|nr:sugar ABC transporter permease [Anaerolineae bacterium]
MSARKRKLTARQRREELEGYAYLAPWLIGFFAFTAMPIVVSILMSFTRYSVLRPPQWLGLRNFQRALGGEDQLMWPSIGRSFYYAVLSVPTRLAGSLLVAMLLNQSLRLTAFWRTLFFLPSLTPSVATAYVWRWILNPEIGVVRMVFDVVGVTMPRWLGSMEWALPSLAMIGLWATVGGSSMIIFLAGLQDVPLELIEAADIDGAGRWRKFWNVTIPMLSPVIFFNLIMGIIRALQVFDLAFVATAGGPGYATRFISLHIYETAFVSFDMGYAAALSWILVVLIVSMTIIQFRLSSTWVFYQGEVRA